jgi:hypothetical protein
MPNQFQTELDTPGAGTDSELYRAVSPLLNLHNLPEGKNSFDRARIEKLKEDLRKGTVGLEYLTGLKRNKAETFYDTHPTQAITSNALASAGTAGAATAAGLPILNFIRQRGGLKDLQKDYSTRISDPKQRMAGKLSPIDEKSGIPRPVADDDVLRVFGDAQSPNSDVVRHRLEAMDQIAAAKGTKGEKPYTAEFDKILGKGKGKTLTPAQKAKLKPFLEGLRGKEEHAQLGQYAELQKDLSTHGHKLKAPIGARLGDKLWSSELGSKINNMPKFVSNLAHSFIPSSYTPHQELVDRRITSKFPNGTPSPDLLAKIVGEGASEEQKTLLNNTLIHHIQNPHSRKAYSKVLKAFGGSALIGGGIAAGGLGLHHVVKALQNQVYGKEKIKDWKRNTLRSRGEFDEANRIK